MVMETWTLRYRHGDMDMEKWKFKKSNGKWKTKAQAIFLNPFTI
jgi:hypothetical protein